MTPEINVFQMKRNNNFVFISATLTDSKTMKLFTQLLNIYMINIKLELLRIWSFANQDENHKPSQPFKLKRS